MEIIQNKLTFGQALEAAKEGKAICREGWNGKGMCVFLNTGAVDGNKVNDETTHIEGIKSALFEKWGEGVVTRLPNLNMRAATGSTVTGWLASQTDLLAEDWCILK